MRRVLLILAVSLMLLTSFATAASAETWYHPGGFDTWDCDYYDDGRYWCYSSYWGQWIGVYERDSMPRNGWFSI